MAYDKVTASMRKKWENEYVKGTSLDDFVDARIKANPILGTGTLQQNEQLTNSDIAPVVGSDNDAKRWYQQIFSRGTLFDDNDGGWFSDTYKTANATGLDMMADVQGGYANSLEKAIDFVAGLIGKLGSDKFQAKTGEFIEKDLINEKKFTSKLNKITNPIAYLSIRKEFKKAYEEAVAQGYEGTEDDFYIEFIENASVFGDFTDSMAQSGGELLAVASLPGGKTQAAAKGWGIAKRIIQGVTAAGGEMESALTQGGATYDEALFSGLVVGGAAALLSEMGSIKFGGVTVPNSLKQALATKVSNSVVRTALSVGCDIAAEGAEEFLEEVIGKLGKKLSYESEKTWKEVFASQEALDDYVSSFVGGGIFGAFGSVPKLSDSASTKRDYTTGLTANEQKVFDKVYEDTIAKREENGDKLTKKDKDEIYNDVMEKLEKGYISIDTIEEVLGGDAYTAYSDAVKNADALVEQEKKLKAEFDTLNKMKKSDMTGEQTDRLEELRGQLKNIKAKISENKKNSQAGKLKSQLSESVRNSLTEVDSKSGKTIRSDDHLLESYNEIARKNQKFEADLSKYDEKQRAAVQRAIDGGLLNNTNKSHDMVDSVANWEAATGIKIDFTNTELLNKMGIGVKGRIVNGAITKDGIAVNIKSKKALNFIVGHELTHAVEQTGEYNDLKDILLTHAKAKGDYNWRAEAIKETYKGLKDTDIDSEIVADLVGEYIFSDKTFVDSLYKKNRNIFQRIYDEIKRLWRLATAGSKEKRELEIAKNLFEDAIRENAKSKEGGKADGEVKHSLGYHAGDLGKAEGYHIQGGSRDTGHFGTGTYFVGDEAKINDSTYGKRPHHAVEFDNYNLYKVYNTDDGYKLHSNLHALDRGVSQEFLDAAKKDQFAVSDLRHEAFKLIEKYDTKKFDGDLGFDVSTDYIGASIRAYSEVAKANGIKIQSYDEWLAKQGGDVPKKGDSDYEFYKRDYIDYLKDALESADKSRNKGYDKFRDAYFDLWLKFGKNNVNKALQAVVDHHAAMQEGGKSVQYGADSNATVFMKALGYEGIDVRGTGLDNVGYGSVIYDLKGEDLAKKNEIGTAKYLLSIDNEADNEYNDYTQTEDFYKRVPYTMQSDFKVYLSHKTNGMAKGETRTFYNCGFIFKATGYMQGKILGEYNDENKHLLRERGGSYGEINDDGEVASVWSEKEKHAYRGGGGDLGLSQGGRGSASNDRLLDEIPERFPSRDNERIWRHSGTEREPSELVKNLRKKLETWGDEPLEVDEDIEQFNNSLRASLKNGAFSNGEGKKFSLGDGREGEVVNGVAVAANVAEVMKSGEYAPPADYMKYSLSTTPDWEKNYLEKNKGENAFSVVQAIRNFNDKMIQSDAIRGYIPTGEYKYTKMGPLRSNQEYIVSFDMDTSCPRTFQFLNFRDAIQRKAGRYLSYNESINLLELMRAYGQQIPCCYCYVENKRVLLSASYNNFFGFRNAVMTAKTTADAEKVMYGYSDKKGLPDASRKALNRWRSDLSYNPSLTEVWTSTNTARNSVLNYLDAQMKTGAINGKTAETKLNKMVLEQFGIKDKGAIVEIESFVKDWTYDTLANIPHIYNIDNDTSVSKVDERALALNHEALAYSKSASSAKNVENYLPYTDQLKNISKEDREFIMGMGGIRKHSSNDFRMDYVQDYFLFYADLAADGWTGHTYTKSADFAKIFACTNDRINMSVAFYEDADGTLRENIDEGAAWRDVKELRKAHKNVGSMAMVTSDNQLSYALNSDWIDMIIPFHASGLDKAVWYNLRMWNDYTSKQGERFYNADTMKQKLANEGVEVPKGANAATVKAMFEQYFGIKHIYGKGGEVLKPHFFPGDTYVNGQLVPGHHNNVKTYFKLCEEYGVHPRFYGITVTDTNGKKIDVTQHPSYLKLIKETARTDSKQEKIQFNFGNYDPYLKMTPFEYATQRLEQEAKNGGFENTKADPYGVVDEFVKEYLGKDRPLGYLTKRAKETRDILLEMSKKNEAKQKEIVNKETEALSLSMKNEPRRDADGWQIYGEDVAYRRPKKGDIAPIAPTATPTETKTAVNASVEDREDIAPVKAPRNPNALSPLKAPANKGDKTIEELVAEHGAIKQGEHPVRNDEMPKSTTGTDKVSNTARTVKGAKVTPPELVDLLDKETAGGRLSYVPITNSETVDKAYASIVSKGWEAARGEWETRVRRGEVSAELTATGGLLLNNAAKAGDTKAWLDILRNYQLMGTNAGQAVQAMRILKTLTPSDSLYMIERSVEQMVEDMKLGAEITLDENLKKAYLNAKNDAEKDAARKALAENIASQIPATAMDKWTAIRYLNMLGNFRTQGRNILGNLGMSVTSRVKNTVAATIESIAEKASGGEFQRTKSVFVNKDLLNAAKEDFANVEHIALNGGKFNDQAGGNQFQQEIQDARTIFKSKPLEKYRKLTNLAMDKGDLVFSKAAYGRALAGYLQANGIKETDFSKIDQKVLDKARDYAIKEAQETTFRDNNWLSSWVTKIGRRSDTPKAGKLLSEGIMPFRKTPANILLRAEEYSPLGIINATVNSIKLAKGNADVTGADVVNSWSKALTGTGLFALGMLLNNAGALAGGADEDEDKDWFESMYGWQNYAIQIGDYNFTIDFLSPSAMPLLMGAQLNELRQDGGIEMKDLESALLSIADPMIEMSMLQGINDTLENIRYSENNMGQFLINACLSYLTQGITNSFLGQLERSFEGQRMTTFVDKDSAIPAWLQKQIGKMSAKTPGWDYNQIPYVDAWGQTEDIAPVGGFLENALSPSYISEGFSDKVYEELNRLNDVQSDINVYPQTPEKTIGDYNLSAEEYERLAKLQGQTQKALVEEIISSDVYAELTDDEKAKAIQLAYKYAKEYSRQQVLNSNGFSTKWMSEAGDNIVDEIIAHTSEERTFAKENPGKYAVAKSVGGYDQYRTYTKELNNFKVSEKKEIYDYINGLDVDYGTKIILYKNKCKSDDTYNNDIVEYLNSRDDISVAEIKSILTELGFTVHSNGRVTW